MAVELSAMMEDGSSVMMGCRGGLCLLKSNGYNQTPTFENNNK